MDVTLNFRTGVPLRGFEVCQRSRRITPEPMHDRRHLTVLYWRVGKRIHLEAVRVENIKALLRMTILACHRPQNSRAKEGAAFAPT